MDSSVDGNPNRGVSRNTGGSVGGGSSRGSGGSVGSRRYRGLGGLTKEAIEEPAFFRVCGRHHGGHGHQRG